jgi:uncharacterized protein YdiU (UPF0061 family)
MAQSHFFIGSLENPDNAAMISTALPEAPSLEWLNRFAQLGEHFLTHLSPTPLPAVHWVSRNNALLNELGWPHEGLSNQDALLAFSGCAIPEGAQPYASVYSGHQFGVWAGQLGDGRALTLGEVSSALGSQEIQLKGAGPTPYSRRGDGRAVLRSSIREYLCSEAMHGLGIPTTRALCLTGSPQTVYREEAETAAVVTRVAPCFVRFGHFEHFAAHEQPEALRTLTDHVIREHLPECTLRVEAGEHQGNRYALLLQVVSDRTAHMVAQWQAVGFCHGVMNTDNMSILGLTLDYGPFQFLDGFNPRHVCNHSDGQGRYAYHRQPQVAFWNLHCLAQALAPLINDMEITQRVLESFKTEFAQALDKAMARKLGMANRELTDRLLQLMAREQVDYSLFWRRLSQAVAQGQDDAQAPDWMAVRDLFLDRATWSDWQQDYTREMQHHAQAQGQSWLQVGSQMLRHNPKYVLRNHLAEIAIRKAKLGDFSEVDTLLTLLQSPFDEHPEYDAYAQLPPDWASSIEISCSS